MTGHEEEAEARKEGAEKEVEDKTPAWLLATVK